MSVFSVLDAEQRNSWKGGHTACLSLVAKTALALVSQHRDWLTKGQVGDEELITVTEDERCYYWYRVRLSAEHYDNLFPLLETELRKLGFDDFMAEFYTLLIVNDLRKEVSRVVRTWGQHAAIGSLHNPIAPSMAACYTGWYDI